VLSYEDVDTTLIPPRPRLYGVVGGDVIERVWKERQAKKKRLAESNGGDGETAAKLPAGSPSAAAS
jgi:succinate dehydrogenase / fumarate reductase, flavoprotein subunit